MIENKSNVYQRLIRHMEINKTSGCWEWQGSKRNGYGRMIIGSRTDGTRKSVSTHRLSYELHKGFLICPNTDMDIWDECYCAHGERTDNDPKEKKGGRKHEQLRKKGNNPLA